MSFRFCGLKFWKRTEYNLKRGYASPTGLDFSFFHLRTSLCSYSRGSLCRFLHVHSFLCKPFPGLDFFFSSPHQRAVIHVEAFRLLHVHSVLCKPFRLGFFLSSQNFVWLFTWKPCRFLITVRLFSHGSPCRLLLCTLCGYSRGSLLGFFYMGCISSPKGLIELPRIACEAIQKRFLQAWRAWMRFYPDPQIDWTKILIFFCRILANS